MAQQVAVSPQVLILPLTFLRAATGYSCLCRVFRLPGEIFIETAVMSKQSYETAPVLLTFNLAMPEYYRTDLYFVPDALNLRKMPINASGTR